MSGFLELIVAVSTWCGEYGDVCKKELIECTLKGMKPLDSAEYLGKKLLLCIEKRQETLSKK